MTNLFEAFELASSLMKGSVLLLVAFIVALAFRNASAANRYRVLFLGLTAALLVPLAATVVPAWNLTLPVQISTSPEAPSRPEVINAETEEPQTDLGRTTSTFDPTKTQRGFRHSIPPKANGKTTHVAQEEATSDRLSAEFHPVAAVQSPIEKTQVQTSESAASASKPPWQDRMLKTAADTWLWWPAVWFVGVCIFLARTLFPFFKASQITRRCGRSSDQRSAQICRELASQLGVREPDLLIHEESTTPFVVGIRRPSIVLPNNSEQWPDQQLRFVLCHELAHIQRRDLITELVARITVSLYWFNPLAWWGLVQMMKLRELACDDCVVQHQNEPSGYAETLLTVARDFRPRPRNQQFQVGMAGQLDITRRIYAVLDSTRSRLPFHKRTSQIVTGIALLTCMAMGALHLNSEAAAKPQATSDAKLDTKQKSQETPNGESKNGTEEQTDSQKKPNLNNVVDEKARSMTIVVLDEDGSPLPEVKIQVSGIDQSRRANLSGLTYSTDESGRTEIFFRKGTLLLQLWPSKPGFVPQTLKLDERQAPLPSEYTFYFVTGETIGGTVLDADSHPVEGATVEVKSAGPVKLSKASRASNPPGRSSSWLATGSGAAVTDSLGRWSINNAPPAKDNPDLNFRLLVNHPDFAGDETWGAMQKEQGITTDQLRDLSAKLTLDRGVKFQGKITGPDGRPVNKGFVTWHADPYRADGVKEVQLQPNGTYEFPQLKAGTYPVTVLAPGFAPDQRKIDIRSDNTTGDFQLKAGNVLKFKVVNPKGEPIPFASVYVEPNGWRGTTALFKDKHPNVPESGIPRHANAKGIYTWDWAPADEVKYGIDAKDHIGKKVTLVASPQTARITLLSGMIIRGNAVDAVTRKPIPKFKVIPVFTTGKDRFQTDTIESHVVHAKHGEYEIMVIPEVSPTSQRLVRIEADGYRTTLGKKTTVSGDPPLVENFELQPAPALLGRVVSSSGNPVNDFHVAFASATSSTWYGEWSSFHTFDDVGNDTFKIAPSFEAQKVRVFNDDEFAEVMVQPDQKEIGTIALKPYATLSGRLMQGDKPISDETVLVYHGHPQDPTYSWFETYRRTQTDADGHYEFKRLPPTWSKVTASLSPWEESVMSSSESAIVKLQPGEHHRVDLNTDGALISGRVVATGRSNDQLSKQWSINYLIRREHSAPAPSDATPMGLPSSPEPLQKSWLEHPDFDTWRATKRNYFVKLDDDGRLKIHGVPVGEYDLVIKLYEKPSGCLVETIGSQVVPITVTSDDVQAGEVKLEDIEVVCRSGPRKGSNMRAFQYKNSNGRVVRINENNGRYVLFHFWAGWCQPCLESMPQLKADIEGLNPETFIAVGLNVDKNEAKAKGLAEQFKMNWTQDYLGEDSDLSEQLGISSVPAYFLIGPDGLLVGSTGTWSEMSKLLHSTISQD